jgi:hypothetical protein
MNARCGQHSQFLSVTTGGTLGYHWAISNSFVSILYLWLCENVCGFIPCNWAAAEPRAEVKETEVCTLHRTSCCMWFAFRIGEVKLWATAVTADIRNFLRIFHTNSNRCFRLRIKPSFFPLSNQDNGSSSNTCIREAAGSNLVWGAVCPEGSVEFSTPAGKFFILCYSMLNPH